MINFARLLSVFAVIVCLCVFATVLSGCGDNNDGREKASSFELIQPAKTPTVDRTELDKEIAWLKKADLYADHKEANEHLRNVAAMLRSDEKLVDEMLAEIKKDPRPEVCKVLVLCLGAARTEEARFGLYEVFLTTTDPRIKALCAAALAMTSNSRIGADVRINVPGVAVTFRVGPLYEEALLQAVINEWESSSEPSSKSVLFEVVKASAPNSKLAADNVWNWVMDTPTEMQSAMRARQVAKELKSNVEMQKTLGEVVLDTAALDKERKIAAEVLSNESVPTISEVNRNLWNQLGNKNAGGTDKALAYLALSADSKSRVKDEVVAPVIASNDVDAKVRIEMMRDIQKAARKKAAQPKTKSTAEEDETKEKPDEPKEDEK